MSALTLVACIYAVYTDKSFVCFVEVDMTWHGHHHSYQRTCPVYKEQCLPFNPDGTAGGPVHLVIGHAGAGLCLNTLPQRPVFWERVELTHGYMRVEANGTTMHCEVCTFTHLLEVVVSMILGSDEVWEVGVSMILGFDENWTWPR